MVGSVFSWYVLFIFKKNGVNDSASGRKYHDEILTPGSSLTANELIFNFLGRKPNNAAFLKSIG